MRERREVGGAYLLALVLCLSEHPIVSPLVALLVVQLTLYQSLVHGLGRVAGVVAGGGVAVLVAHPVGLTWWSLGAVVAGSIVIGKVLRLGPHLFEAPISAMLLLEVGGGELGLTRVEEAVVGALVGIAVSLLVAPPLYLQPAGAAIGELAERMARFTGGFAVGLRGRGRAARPTGGWRRRGRSAMRSSTRRRPWPTPRRRPGSTPAAAGPRRPPASALHAHRARTVPRHAEDARPRRPRPHLLRAARRSSPRLQRRAAPGVG
jgi:Aromatic acid exporter family member 1